MLTFLFEQYGYYPSDFVDKSFYIDNWFFKLVEIQEDENYVNKINEYMGVVRNIFPGKGPFLIKTRFDKSVSFYDGKKYVLISIYKFNASLNELNKFHCLMMEDKKKIDLNKLLDVWKERMTDIEMIYLNSLRVDSIYYWNNLEISMFFLGLCQNALQYMSEVIIDYGAEFANLAVVHKRLVNLESVTLLDPFNFIVDHPLKDLVELYKNDFLTFVDLLEMLKFYELDKKEASVLMARVLYPSNVFDEIEENGAKKRISFCLKYNIEKELQKIKKIYLHLRNVYNIRPIDWLES